MGPMSSPALFASVVEAALAPFIMAGFVTVHVDDVCIHSSSLEEHITHLDMVLAALGKPGLRVSLGPEQAVCSYLRDSLPGIETRLAPYRRIIEGRDTGSLPGALSVRRAPRGL